MKPSVLLTAWLFGVVPVLVTASIPACAGEEATAPEEEPYVPVPLPEAGGEDGQADGECEASDACARRDCKQADFCPVSVPIGPVITLNAIWGNAPNDIWAVGTRGTIVHGDGTTFTIVPSGTTAMLLAVWGTAPDDVWIMTPDVPLHSESLPDGGAAFLPVSGNVFRATAKTRSWTIWGASRDEVWIAGDPSQRFNGNGSLWSKTSLADGGLIWNAVASSSTLRSLWGGGPNDLWCVGTDGKIYRYGGSVDGGPKQWVERNSLSTATLESVWGTSASDVWTVGAGGTIRHITGESGHDIVAVDSPTLETLHGVWGSGPSDVWAVGDRATVLHYDGNEWSRADAGLEPDALPDLFGVWGTGPGDVWIVGDGIVIHRTAENRRRP